MLRVGCGPGPWSHAAALSCLRCTDSCLLPRSVLLVSVRCRKPRPVNLDVFTKQLLHRDLSVYEERKAQQSKQ